MSKEATDTSRPSSTKLSESRAFLLLPIISPPLFSVDQNLRSKKIICVFMCWREGVGRGKEVVISGALFSLFVES